MKKQTEAEKLKSILVIVIGFLFLFLLFKKIALFYVALGVGFFSLALPISKEWILYVWEKIAHILGWINTRILLAAVFYVFLFPIAMLSRVFNKNMLQLRKSEGSVFIERNHQYSKEDLENTW